jgi:GTP-binding protein SAR1
MWKDYFPAIDAIVFLIDASKTDRFKEAKTELDALLEEEQILNCPILILANKIDKLNAVSEDYMREYFNLKTTGKLKCTTNERPLEIFMSSLVCKQGFGDGFRWLSEYF